MEIEEIEPLVEIFKTARISELTVSTGSGNKTTVRLRKTMPTVAAPSHVPVGRRDMVSPAAEIAPSTSEISGVFVTAPMVGIFHSIDSVSAMGTTVRAGQVMGTIESMKLMNDILSDHDGIIAEVLVEDGMPVEYGQKLFLLDQD